MQNSKLWLNFLVSFFLSIGLSACQASNDEYYRLHPKKLEKALIKCQTKTTESCQQLEQIAMDLNRLAYQLKSSPQGFGQKIIAMQIKKVGLMQPANQGKQQELKQVDKDLAQYLAVVKWLESPES